MAASTKIPAAAPTTAPLTSLVTLVTTPPWPARSPRARAGSCGRTPRRSPWPRSGAVRTAQEPRRLRIRARTRPPAKAAPTRISGRSCAASAAGRPPSESDAPPLPPSSGTDGVAAEPTVPEPGDGEGPSRPARTGRALAHRRAVLPPRATRRSPTRAGRRARHSLRAGRWRLRIGNRRGRGLTSGGAGSGAGEAGLPTRSFGRVLVEHAAPDHRGHALGGDAGQRADPGEQARPHESS